MIREIEAKSVLNKTKKRDSWFLDDYTFNPYSSCSFNCLYCYIRGSKYGINLAEKLSVKTNAIEILDRQLANRARKGQYGIIVVSSATDPYLQVEERYRLTRSALQVILKHRFPVHILTKSDLIERDFDLLSEIDKSAILPVDLSELARGVIVSFSFSTIKDDIARIFEPGAVKPSVRLGAVQKTLDAGFLAGVSMMPLIPFISDTKEQLQLIFSTFKQIDVDYLIPATLTLHGDQPADSKTLMLTAIKRYYPELEKKYLKIFSNNSQMPAYYRTAFYKKMKELGNEFDLQDNILEAALNKNQGK